MILGRNLWRGKCINFRHTNHRKACGNQDCGERFPQTAIQPSHILTFHNLHTPQNPKIPSFNQRKKVWGPGDFPQKSLGRRRHVFPDGQSSFPQPSSCPSGTRPESAANAVEQLCTFSAYDLSRQLLSFTTNLFLPNHKKETKKPQTPFDR